METLSRFSKRVPKSTQKHLLIYNNNIVSDTSILTPQLYPIEA